jgi:uncharacterized short protein YbdD (DUF466 family)
LEKTRTFLRKASSSVKTMFGIPDYEKYLEHHRIAHPDQEPMTEKEFYLQRLKDRYESGGTTRCC